MQQQEFVLNAIIVTQREYRAIAFWNLNMAIAHFMEAFGIEYKRMELLLKPVLRSDESQLKYSINTGKSRYKVTISKTKEFKRFLDTKYTLLLDGKEHSSNLIPIFDDNATYNRNQFCIGCISNFNYA